MFEHIIWDGPILGLTNILTQSRNKRHPFLSLGPEDNFSKKATQGRIASVQWFFKGSIVRKDTCPSMISPYTFEVTQYCHMSYALGWYLGLERWEKSRLSSAWIMSLLIIGFLLFGAETCPDQWSLRQLQMGQHGTTFHHVSMYFPCNIHPTHIYIYIYIYIFIYIYMYMCVYTHTLHTIGIHSYP